MVGRLVLVLGDQLTETLSALAQADKARDTVVMAEVADEAAYVRHHPKKIALIFAAMRKFAHALEQDGWKVVYTQLDDTDNAGSIVGELLRRAAQTGASEVLATEPGEWRLIDKLKYAPLKVHLLPDDRFLATHAEFEAWAEGRKALRMEYFYREMRRKTGLLMEGDQPAGGKWNFDHDNRKAAPEDVTVDGPLRFDPDATTREVLELVQARFGDNFGALEPFWFATTRAEALQALDHFIANALPRFGDYQDAMLNESEFLYHAILSPYLNIGLLNVTEICEAAANAYAAGHAPINAAEGFIRQIIGWREYVRGIYFLEGPDYTARNILGHDRDLPWFYWGGETRMNCVAKAVGQTRTQAYAHHIQRLMVTGNFALLAGIDPAQVHEWYLAVYADAFEWVEAPNTIGMSQFADGGVIASKPYVSSGAYINRMSDHCKSCHYSVSAKTGDTACPFNLLYWHFLDRHRDRFSNNPRMGNMYRTWDRMDADKRKTVLAEGDALLARLDAGEVI
ncbi:cryptochrome/photolyase family protein [Sulfitobacter pontiacus]|jgi:deoxyribodipyrimidine photolyase-related protein|uniref:cryptochrome/photolyase family protein n=1 Tax=Sulfitobacter pontiacus TaxID=60137 RepID=UPI000C3962EC|nr:cryptochrome/photolyase family protein [Sulfitobacter pontiacus]MAN08568.1 cryptochrome/photolyase family protein [Roseobacter sp.]HJO50616.1 cryptochrome/photolyase family protein [Sulfitobacter pontiacus]|tara:strand:+ start:1457 stop:2986 length:1530 start_codon:yes stop_codon:yes gene_type:complete